MADDSEVASVVSGTTIGTPPEFYPILDTMETVLSPQIPSQSWNQLSFPGYGSLNRSESGDKKACGLSNKQGACAGTNKVSNDNVEDSGTESSSLVLIGNVTSNTWDPVCGGESKNIDSPKKHHVGSSMTFKPKSKQNVKQIHTSHTEDKNARIISNVNTRSVETVRENPADMNTSCIDMSVFDSQKDMFDSQTTTEEIATKSQVISDPSVSQSEQIGFNSQFSIMTPLLQFDTSQPQVSHSGSDLHDVVETDMSFVVAENQFLHSSCQNEAVSHRSVDSQVDLLTGLARVITPLSLAGNNLLDDKDDDGDSFVSVSTIPPQQTIISSAPNVILMSSCRSQMDSQNIQMPVCAFKEHEQNNKTSPVTQNHAQITASSSVKSLSQVQMSSGDLMEISFSEEMSRKLSEYMCVGKHSDNIDNELCSVLPPSSQSPLIAMSPLADVSADARDQSERNWGGKEEGVDEVVESQVSQAPSCFIIAKNDSSCVKIDSNVKGSASKCCHVMDGNIMEAGNFEVDQYHGSLPKKSCGVISDKTSMCNDHKSKQTYNTDGDKTEEYNQPLICDIHKVGERFPKATGSLGSKGVEGSFQTSWLSQSTVVSSVPSSQHPSLGNSIKTRNKKRLEIHAQELQSLNRLIGLYDKMLGKLASGLISDGKNQLQKFEHILSKLNKKQEDEMEKLLASKEKHSKSANMKLRMKQLLERQTMLQAARKKHTLLEQRILVQGPKAGCEKMMIQRKAAVNPAYCRETGELNFDSNIQCTRKISECGTASQKSHYSISSQATSTAPSSSSKTIRHEPPEQTVLPLSEGDLDLEKPAQIELLKGTESKECLQIATLNEDPNSAFPLSATGYTHKTGTLESSHSVMQTVTKGDLTHQSPPQWEVHLRSTGGYADTENQRDEASKTFKINDGVNCSDRDAGKSLENSCSKTEQANQFKTSLLQTSSQIPELPDSSVHVASTLLQRPVEKLLFSTENADCQLLELASSGAPKSWESRKEADIGKQNWISSREIAEQISENSQSQLLSLTHKPLLDQLGLDNSSDTLLTSQAQGLSVAVTEISDVKLCEVSDTTIASEFPCSIQSSAQIHNLFTLTQTDFNYTSTDLHTSVSDIGKSEAQVIQTAKGDDLSTSHFCPVTKTVSLTERNADQENTPKFAEVDETEIVSKNKVNFSQNHSHLSHDDMSTGTVPVENLPTTDKQCLADIDWNRAFERSHSLHQGYMTCQQETCCGVMTQTDSDSIAPNLSGNNCKAMYLKTATVLSPGTSEKKTIAVNTSPYYKYSKQNCRPSGKKIRPERASSDLHPAKSVFISSVTTEMNARNVVSTNTKQTNPVAHVIDSSGKTNSLTTSPVSSLDHQKTSLELAMPSNPAIPAEFATDDNSLNTTKPLASSDQGSHVKFAVIDKPASTTKIIFVNNKNIVSSTKSVVINNAVNTLAFIKPDIAVSSTKPVVINNAVNTLAFIKPDTAVRSTKPVLNVKPVSVVSSTQPVMINRTVSTALPFVPNNSVTSTKPVMINDTPNTARPIVPDNSVNSIKPVMYSEPVSFGLCKPNNTDNSPSRFRPNIGGNMFKPSHPSSPCSPASSSLFPVSSKELLRRMDLQLAAGQQSNQTMESLHTCQAQSHLNLPNVTQSQALGACMNTVTSIPLCVDKAHVQYVNTSTTGNHNLSSTQESFQADYTSSTYNSNTADKHSVSSMPVKLKIVSQMQTNVKPVRQNDSRGLQSCSLPLPAAVNVGSMTKERFPGVSTSVSFSSPLCSVGHTYSVGPSSAILAQSQCKRKNHEKVQIISEKKKRGRPRKRSEEAQSNGKNILNRSGKNHKASTSQRQVENSLPGVEVLGDSSDMSTYECCNLINSDNHIMLQVESTQNESNTKKILTSKKSASEPMLSNGELDIAKLIDNLRTVQLISDRELNITDFDEEFWEEDFAEIVMSQVLWSTVDTW